jgi:ABC-2 type transport system ATP-binding protein
MTPVAGDGVLIVRGLEKSFHGHLSLGRTVVLRGLDLTVRRGEVYGFIGANGAGKTTTIKIVTGLIRADAGSVTLLGREAPHPASRRRLGFMPEQPAFYRYLTGREFLDLQAWLAGVPVADHQTEVARRLQEVGMADRADRPIRKCSKGMLQRLGIAQALLGSPELLVLDEPMSGLDPAGRRDVRDLILAQREQGTTVFFSSHILSDAEVLCDRVGILREGHLALEGSLDEILQKKISTWEVTAVGAGAWNGDGSFREISRRGDRVLYQVEGEESLARLLEQLRNAGATLHSVAPYRHSLEERFLDVVEGRGAGR